jgi:hypothetical protein
VTCRRRLSTLLKANPVENDGAGTPCRYPVARATAVCFLRCECLRGRGVGRPRDPSHRWGARCSSGRDNNLENRASVRLCGTIWEPLKNGRAAVRRGRASTWQLQLSHRAVKASTDEQRTGYARGVAIVHPPNKMPRCAWGLMRRKPPVNCYFAGVFSLATDAHYTCRQTPPVHSPYTHTQMPEGEAAAKTTHSQKLHRILP